MFNQFVSGHPLIKFETIDSTNNYAANLVRNHKLAPGTVIVSDYQTKGKGQRGNNWLAESAKNLLFSLVLYPELLPVKEQYLISLITSLSLYHVVSESFIDSSNCKVSIKWPNDILVEKKKIAGILIENASSSNLLDSSIVGIGFNINQIEFGMLEATSLKVETNIDFNRRDVLALFLENFDRYYHILKSKTRINEIREEYLSLLYLFNEPARFLYRNKRITGIITGITDFGMLELFDMDHSESIVCDIKEIVYL